MNHQVLIETNVCALIIVCRGLEMVDGITNSLDMSLGELREVVMDREAWCAAIHGGRRFGHD